MWTLLIIVTAGNPNDVSVTNIAGFKTEQSCIIAAKDVINTKQYLHYDMQCIKVQ